MFISAMRVRPVAYASWMRVRVRPRCSRSSGRNSGPVRNTGQLRQALACGPLFCTGSPQ